MSRRVSPRPRLPSLAMLRGAGWRILPAPVLRQDGAGLPVLHWGLVAAIAPSGRVERFATVARAKAWAAGELAGEPPASGA